MEDIRVGFIGAGQMATAMALGFVQSSLLPKNNIFLSSPLQNSELAKKNFKFLANNVELAQKVDIVIIAVKPHIVLPVLEEISESINGTTKLVVSIAAGISLESIQNKFEEGIRVIRVMPNTPCMVGLSASAFSAGYSVKQEEKDLVCKLMSCCGVCYEVTENLMDIITATSGSGPAYAYLLIESMIDAAVRHGLPRNKATSLVAQTVKGAAEMVLKTGDSPATLRHNVCSPGGTTIAAIAELEKSSFRAAVFNGVEAAFNKSAALGK